MYVCFVFMTKHRDFKHTYMLKAWFYTKSESVCMYVWDIHTYIHAQLPETYIHTRSAAWDIHTYMLRRPQTYIHTCLGLSDVHTYMLRVGLELKHTYIHVWRLARLLEVPPLTNLKKLNWWSNTERFSWGIWHPPKQADFVGLRETYIHAQEPQTYIHTYSLFARRINKDFNERVPNGIEIPKRASTEISRTEDGAICQEGTTYFKHNNTTSLSPRPAIQNSSRVVLSHNSSGVSKECLWP